MPSPLAHALGRHLGADLSRVRLHTGPEAATAVATAGARRAFASSEHIVVADPAFNAGSRTGRALLAHEAAHVVQQRSSSSSTVMASRATLETEARRSAQAFASNATAPPVSTGRAPAGAVQADEPAGAGVTAGTPPLQLDPELEAEMFVARWLAQQAGAGTTGVPTALPRLPANWLGPPRLGAETLDVGSLFTPYYQRGLMPATHGDTRDVDTISGLFADRYRLVRQLPDLPALAPDFVRSWIPANWRVQLAATLTSTTIDFALSRDNPTFFDLSNQAMERFTGATTYSLPMLPVPVLNDWWNRISGGGGGR